MNLLKKCNFILLALFIWLLTVLYNGIFVNYMSDLILSISNPSWFGFVAHILIQLLIICITTIITIKYLDLNLKQLLFSIAIMYLLFAVYSPPALYMFVFTGEWNGFWQQSHPAMPSWKASIFITLQYGIVMLITTLIACRKKCANNQKWKFIFNIRCYDGYSFRQRLTERKG